MLSLQQHMLLASVGGMTIEPPAGQFTTCQLTRATREIQESIALYPVPIPVVE